MSEAVPVALVTGSSRGIGRGIALELARGGWSVAINYAGNRAAAEECRALAAEASPPGSGATFEIVQADIAKSEDRARLVADVTKRFGWLDLLVNNAGVAAKVRVDILETTEESFDRLLAVNVKGPYFLTQAVANFWLARPEELARRERKPRVVTIGSVSAYAAGLNRGEYCVSKAALAMLTPLFAFRLAEHGIQVFEVRPGVIATDMTAPAHVKQKYDQMVEEGGWPIRRWGTPEDIGRAVRAVAEDRFPFSTGEVLNVDGGFHLRKL